MSGADADEFETDRLLIRAVQEADLGALLDVYLSNPGYLAFTEGSAGEPGRYDRGMLERDFVIAAITPERRLSGIFRKPSGELVGVLDWQELPPDGKPWIGLLMIRADRQRHGYASEAFDGLARRLQAAGKRTIGGAVIKRNPAGRALAERLGFTAISTKTVRMAAEEDVIVLDHVF